MTTFVALGDSITVGMGDPAPEGGGWRGWATLLAGTLPQPEVHNLATLGALAADVEHVQLPAATAMRPDLASVVVGINDTLRGDFDPERTGASVGRTVAALRAAGAEVLTMRLPDPGQMFGLPGALARPLARRMRAVNAVTASSPAAFTRCWRHQRVRSALAPTPSRPVRRRPGWPKPAGWPPRAPRG
jgi:lysophospholipase L1-like esterase